MDAWGLRVVTCAALALAAGGCPKQRSTMDAPPAINPPPPVEADVGVRVDELGGLSKKLAGDAEKLPGGSPEEHHAALREAFSDLAQVLPILYGPQPEGSQRQQLRIIESARTQLSSPAQGLSLEPTIDTALRAARDSLEALGRGSYFDRPQIAQALDQLDAKVTGLDAARGASHPQAVADAMQAASRVVGLMSDTLGERLRDDRPEQPAQKPDNAPTGGTEGTERK
jgi:hypothetical protein